MRARNIFFTVILVLVLGNLGSNYAQESFKQSLSDPKNIIDVYFINGYALGYLVNHDSVSAVRMVCDLSSSYSYNEDDDDAEFPVRQKNGTHRINFSVQYLVSIYGNKIGDIYVGCGPFFGYEWNHNSTTRQNHAYETEDYNYDGVITTGLTGLLGFKSMVSSTFSVFAEAQLTGGRSWRNYETKITTTSEYTNGSNKTEHTKNGWFYNFTSVRLGIRFMI